MGSRLTVSLAAGALAAGLFAGTPAHADAVVVDPCAEVDWTSGWLVGGADPTTVLTGGPVTIQGESHQLDLDRLGSAANPFTGVSRTLWYRSLHWLAIAGRAAYIKGRLDLLDRAVDIAAQYHTQLPDPGGADPGAATAAGWDEGSVTRRQEAVNCLFNMARDAGLFPQERLEPALLMLSSANLDPARHLGPPLRAPHNHGLLANKVLWTTGNLLGRANLVEAAINRLTTAFSRSFSPAGFNIEGSSVYQFMLYSDWLSVADRLRTEGRSAQAVRMEADLQRVLATSWHMLQPDGKVNVIGDGVPDPDNDPVLPVPSRRPLVLRDPTALYAARFSFTDPRTPYVTLRVGRTRGPHGHSDFGALTWFAGNRPVIVDPGFYDYDPGEINSWLASRSAHNVPANRNAGSAQTTASLRQSAQTRNRGFVAATIRSSRSAPITRRIDYSRQGELKVSDKGRQLATHSFTLDSRFTKVRYMRKRTKAVVSGGGASVVVTVAKGARLSHVRGRTGPRAGWQSTGWQTLTPAIRLTATGKRALTTTFRVRG